MAIVRGILLAMANMIIIAPLLALKGDQYIPIDLVFLGAGLGPVAGGLAGFVAGRLATAPLLWRLAVLALPAFGLLVLLSALFAAPVLLGVAVGPTLTSVILLERGTRRAPPEPQVAVAIARAARATEDRPT